MSFAHMVSNARDKLAEPQVRACISMLADLITKIGVLAVAYHLVSMFSVLLAGLFVAVAMVIFTANAACVALQAGCAAA